MTVGLAPGRAAAAVYRYVDWTVADVAAGTASGTITLPDASVVTVTFAATTPTGAAGNLYGAQTVSGAGNNYWLPDVPYISTQVENPPPSTDILQLQGGDNQVYTVTLSEPIKDPVMAIVSLGQPGVPTTYNFDSPFTIVSQGVGFWGGSATALVQLPNNVLQGSEGHGTIQFIGTFAKFSWTVPTPEGWHGFTFAIRTTERLEPTPDGGAGAGGGAGGGAAAGGGGGASGNGGVGGSAGAAGGIAGTGGAAGVGGGAGAAGSAGTGGAAGEQTAGRGGGGGGAAGAATGGQGGIGMRREGGGCGCGLGGGFAEVTVPATGLGLLALTLLGRRRRRSRA